jgi:hypothetical protein
MRRSQMIDEWPALVHESQSLVLHLSLLVASTQYWIFLHVLSPAWFSMELCMVLLLWIVCLLSMAFSISSTYGLVAPIR